MMELLYTIAGYSLEIILVLLLIYFAWKFNKKLDKKIKDMDKRDENGKIQN